jgi:uncharacterized SAM-binding protein YcdF (DUF218 family)
MIAALKQIFLPPGLFLFMGIAGLTLYWKGRKALGRELGIAGLAGLYLVSTPLLSGALMGLAQWGIEPLEDPGGAQVIVILSADALVPAPEYGGPATVGAMTLERIRYGARLHGETKLPILVSGGGWGPKGYPLGQMMSESLTRDFGAGEVWVEPYSSNTKSNARHSAAHLKEKNISHILLVTHAWHMPRARAAFEREGLAVTAAPTGFQRVGPFSLTNFLPQARALHESYYATHELVGRLWYWVR